MLAFFCAEAFLRALFLARSCGRGCCSYANRISRFFFCGRRFRVLLESFLGWGNARFLVTPKPLFAHFSEGDLATVDVGRMKMVSRSFFV